MTMRKKTKNMRFHIYGQQGFIDLPDTATIQDLKTLAWFNRFIRNYLKMQIIQSKNHELN